MSFDGLVEVHQTLDAVDADAARERAEMEAEREMRSAEMESKRG
jgi:hypothetical protein